MALPPLDIYVPSATFNFFPVFSDLAQQNWWKVQVAGAPLASGTANDLHHCLRNDSSYRP